MINEIENFENKMKPIEREIIKGTPGTKPGIKIEGG